MSILTQTALALSYLHAKEIVHGRLSAHNIFLETKVPLCSPSYVAIHNTVCAGEGVSAGLRPRAAQHAVHCPRAGGGGGGGGHQGRGLSSAQCEYCPPHV